MMTETPCHNSSHSWFLLLALAIIATGCGNPTAVAPAPLISVEGQGGTERSAIRQAFNGSRVVSQQHSPAEEDEGDHDPSDDGGTKVLPAQDAKSGLRQSRQAALSEVLHALHPQMPTASDAERLGDALSTVEGPFKLSSLTLDTHTSFEEIAQFMQGRIPTRADQLDLNDSKYGGQSRGFRAVINQEKFEKTFPQAFSTVHDWFCDEFVARLTNEALPASWRAESARMLGTLGPRKPLPEEGSRFWASRPRTLDDDPVWRALSSASDHSDVEIKNAAWEARKKIWSGDQTY
jgi:hypothetical protein